MAEKNQRALQFEEYQDEHPPRKNLGPAQGI